MGASADADRNDFAGLFEALPIGAFRSRPDGTMLRANAALVRMNGFASEAELLAELRDLEHEWYVEPGRRAEFMRRLDVDGRVVGFVSEVWRYKTRERIWVSENARAVRDAQGLVRFYEGTVEEISARVQAEQALQRSQARLQQIVALLPGVVFRAEIAPDGARRRYTFMSEGLRDLYHIEPAAALADGEALMRRLHPEDHARFLEQATHALRGRLRLEIEHRVLPAGGGEKWVRLISAPAPSEDGQEVRVGLVFDISARKRAEQAVLEQAQRWMAALQASGDGVWDWRLRDGVELLSPQCKALYGYGPDELPDSPDALDERTHRDDRAQMLADREAHFAGRTPRYVNEHRVQHRDGHWLWVLSRGMVIERDAQGAPLRMVGTHTDITDRRQAEALRAERDRAAAADLAKTQFLSRVSHELRTPLNAILGFAQLLEIDPGAGERQAAWVRQLLASGRHLLALMDDILDLSGVQSGELPLELAALPLRAVVEEAYSMLAGAARDAGIAVHDEVAADGGGSAGAGAGAGLSVRADRRRLKQVISNLLSNAIKYNRPGGWVRLSARRAGDAVWLQVADSGPGLSAEQLARLFRPFERVGAQRGAVPGTGLGLALSRQLAEAMGGAIEVESRLGKGSVFSLRLPAG